MISRDLEETGRGFLRSFLAKTGRFRDGASAIGGEAIDRMFRGAVIRCGFGRRGMRAEGVQRECGNGARIFERDFSKKICRRARGFYNKKNSANIFQRTLDSVFLNNSLYRIFSSFNFCLISSVYEKPGWWHIMLPKLFFQE
jgi:hypothetical protein